MPHSGPTTPYPTLSIQTCFDNCLATAFLQRTLAIWTFLPRLSTLWPNWATLLLKKGPININFAIASYTGQLLSTDCPTSCPVHYSSQPRYICISLSPSLIHQYPFCYCLQFSKIVDFSCGWWAMQPDAFHRKHPTICKFINCTNLWIFTLHTVILLLKNHCIAYHEHIQMKLQSDCLIAFNKLCISHNEQFASVSTFQFHCDILVATHQTFEI